MLSKNILAPGNSCCQSSGIEKSGVDNEAVISDIKNKNNELILKYVLPQNLSLSSDWEQKSSVFKSKIEDFLLLKNKILVTEPFYRVTEAQKAFIVQYILLLNLIH